MGQKHRRLVILSIPFMRLTRMLLGAPVLIPLRQHCDLVVVSPFADNPDFQAEFRGSETRFLQWKTPCNLSKLLRGMFYVSELLRVQGYWRRYRNQGMTYYLSNNHLKFGNDGNDERISLFRQIALFLISVVGMCPDAWRILDRLIGRFLFNFPELQKVARGYDQVTLIQSASWGIQDRMLAWMGRTYNFRAVLIPYTTDQLFCNGYLMSHFKAVCVQGPFEEQCAMHLHRLPAARIVRLGSAWFRHIDQIKQELDSGQVLKSSSTRKVIIYAGTSSRYFPRTSEYIGLETLLKAIQSGQLDNVEVVYRPLGETEEIRRRIKQKWEQHTNLRIQFAQEVCWGLDQYGKGNVGIRLREYVSQLLEADLIVMVYGSSMCLDAAFLGVPTIANFADPSQTLQKRKTSLMFDSENRIIGLSEIPVVHEIDQMVPMVQAMLKDQERARFLACRLAEDWDFRKTDFPSTLVGAALGTTGADDVLEQIS